MDGQLVLKDDEIEVALVRTYVELSQGAHKPMYSVLQDRYRIWRGGLGRWHWSLRVWPDDGLGLPSHGSTITLRRAVKACLKNYALRQEVYE